MAGNHKNIIWADERKVAEPKPEKSGGPTSYYLVDVVRPNQGKVPYQAECGDIIEALGMNFNEGCAFKALWRTAAARTLGKLKEGGDARYDAQKVQFYGGRMLAQFEPPLADSGTLGEMPVGLVISPMPTLEDAKNAMQFMIDHAPGFREYVDTYFTRPKYSQVMKREANGTPFTGIERAPSSWPADQKEQFHTKCYVNGWEVTEKNFWEFMDTLDDNDIRKMHRFPPGSPHA